MLLWDLLDTVRLFVMIVFKYREDGKALLTSESLLRTGLLRSKLMSEFNGDYS